MKPLIASIRATIEAKRLLIRWRKVKGHAGIAANERADALAKEGARQAQAKVLAKAPYDFEYQNSHEG